MLDNIELEFMITTLRMDASDGVISIKGSKYLAALEELLALRKERERAEPVAFVKSGYALCYFRPPREYGLKIGDKLYAAPPAPVVPDDIPAGLAGTIISLCAYNVRDKELAQKIWNACRAAMLKETADAAS